MTAKSWRKPLDVDKVKRLRADIHILKDQCKGCGYCIEFCPKKVLEKSNVLNKRGVHPPEVKKQDECVICCFCSLICPDFAIYVTAKNHEGGC
jgi:2-oxoglutarate ferredoxin oxidoreductase subunit delta